MVDLIRPSDNPAQPGIRHHYTLVDLAATWQGGEPVAGDDVTEAAWFPLTEIGGLALWDETIRVIRLARERLVLAEDE